MKRLLAISLLGSYLLIGSNSVKADYDYLQINTNGSTVSISGANKDGSVTLLKTFTTSYGNPTATAFVDEYNGLLHIGGNGGYHTYDPETGVVSDLNISNDSPKFLMTYPWKGKNVIKSNTDGSIQIGGDTNDIDVVEDGLNIDGDAVITKNTDGSVQIGGDTDDIDIVSDGLNIDGDAVVTKNADGSIQIGADGNDIDITSEGLTVDGVSLITKKDSGEIHIGKNSLITKEEDGVQKLYAQDENGDAININVTEGTKLLIDGVEVQTGDSAQVTKNKNNISTNTSNISTNTSNISTNTSNISTNTSNISTNTSNISTNTSNISTNTSNISTNTSNISTNTSNISTNTSNISTNTSNISTNTSNISTNTSNIKNLGSGVAGSTALTAALTALPQTSKESKLSCGVGTGAYSSRYAVGFGCASKLNERVDINAGGSYVFGGSKSYGEGTLDSGVAKAGFVFKLGELKQPTHISMKDKKVMETKIESLEEKNKKILSKNQKLENKLSILMARLEKIEKIALSESKSKDIAVYKLK